MSRLNTSFQSYFPYPHCNNFANYYQAPLTYAALPLLQPVEYDPYPVLVCTFCPTFATNFLSNHVLEESYETSPNSHDGTFSDCVSAAEESGFGDPSNPSVDSVHVGSESLSIQNSTLEGNETPTIHRISLSTAYSAHGDARPLNHGWGFYGSDGYWYPCSPDGVYDLNDGTSSHEPDEASLEVSIPTKLVMPKSLMSFYNCYQRLDLPSAVLGRPRLIPTLSSNGNVSLVVLWEAHMKLLFRNFPHPWILHPTLTADAPSGSWHTFRDLAKVRFYCEQCLDGWTSMFGVVVFFFAWSPSTEGGEVYYQVAGQRCGKCSSTNFKLPLWYPEEAQKVITNLYYEIASRVYGLRTPHHIRTRRLGQPLKHHNRDLCQGCDFGRCKPDPLFEPTQEMSVNEQASVGQSLMDLPSDLESQVVNPPAIFAPQYISSPSSRRFCLPSYNSPVTVVYPYPGF